MAVSPLLISRINHIGLVATALLVAVLLVVSSQAAVEPVEAKSVRPPVDWRDSSAFQKVSSEIEAWLGQLGGEASIRRWREAVQATPLAARLGAPLLQIAADSDERLAELLSSLPKEPPSWLAEKNLASLRLAIAEEHYFASDDLATRHWLEGLLAEAVYSQELLYYLQAVSSHRLIDYKSTREALAKLGENQQAFGAARQSVLNQVQRDLATEPVDLPLVSRQMQEAGRQLALGTAGESTLQRQQQALDLLDSLIKKLEKKQQQQQAAASAAGGSNQEAPPAEDSKPSELKAPGEVDRRRLVQGESWGSLPPAERERLTQDLLRDYPPRYRSLVEDYFQTLADPESTDRDEVLGQEPLEEGANDP